MVQNVWSERLSDCIADFSNTIQRKWLIDVIDLLVAIMYIKVAKTLISSANFFTIKLGHQLASLSDKSLYLFSHISGVSYKRHKYYHDLLHVTYL